MILLSGLIHLYLIFALGLQLNMRALLLFYCFLNLNYESKKYPIRYLLFFQLSRFLANTTPCYDLSFFFDNANYESLFANYKFLPQPRNFPTISLPAHFP